MNIHRAGWALALIAGLGARGALAQSFQFSSRTGETTAYCGAPVGGPLVHHVFQTAAPTDDLVSVSDPGNATRSPSSAQAHLVSGLSGPTLSIDASGASTRTGTLGGANATGDARDNWVVTLSSSACFRLSVSLSVASTSSPSPTQGFNFGANGGGLIRLSNGSTTTTLTHSLAAPGSWSAEFSGTLAPGQYFLSLSGRSEGNGSPFNGSFHHTADLALVSCPCSPDFNRDGDIGTDADIEAFFACLSGSCCATCGSADFNGDGDIGTDADIESFFRVLAGGSC